MLERLDEALARGHGDFTATSAAVRPVGTTGSVRVTVKLAYRGHPWGTVPVEIAPAEGRVGEELERVPVRALDAVGLSSPTDVACVSIRYQMAQKLHACTQVFEDGPANRRFRDLIDVLLLRELMPDDDLPRVRAACVEIFTLRATHPWPPELTTVAEWREPYAELARETAFPLTDVDSAATAVGLLIDEIDGAHGST